MRQKCISAGTYSKKDSGNQRRISKFAVIANILRILYINAIIIRAYSKLPQSAFLVKAALPGMTGRYL